MNEKITNEEINNHIFTETIEREINNAYYNSCKLIKLPSSVGIVPDNWLPLSNLR